MLPKTVKASVGTLADETKAALQQMRREGADVLQLRERAHELLDEARLSDVTIPFPLERDHPEFGKALRVQYVNGEPQPIATIWVRL